MGRHRRALKYLTCALATVAALWGTSVRAADTIKIGALEPRSGPMEAVGRFMSTGFIFAVEEQNAKGGLLGKKIEIVWEDSEMKGDVANRKAKKLILEDKVDMLASGAGSPVAVALNKVSATNKVLYFNYGAMTDDIQGREFSPYGFRLCDSMHNVYAALALAMKEKPYRKFYIIAPDYLSGYDTAKKFREQLKLHVPEATIVGEDFHPIANKDFAPYVTKILAAKPDAILAGSFGPDLINLVKTARSMGLKPPFPILTHALEPVLLYQVKDDGVGIIGATQYSMRVKGAENEDLIKRFAAFRDKRKKEMDYQTWWPNGALAAAALGWKVVFAAIEKAGTLDPDKVIQTLEGFQYKTPVGTYTMRKCDHQMIMPLYGVQIAAGASPFYDGTIGPPDVKIPWEGAAVQSFAAEKVALPATKEYNPRCQ